ncbi:right-handed parallel beta-helix repeat-containing protein [Ructibacterium gallinarum]|uniref:Right-handed parallel beta-helix repeat-containing protein n=1 Tax=Ructibacterium gallinarum TaxID=2779355 RepID=A0A9D5M5B8_9FIRM|nr:right-handed parallel beta-helix repeat-containing protein [Ructibacterium gallinarum]MBE5039707.1 right-handed parallel beta-helix repeat-containing protein [Ructibacterium gallinarum]
MKKWIAFTISVSMMLSLLSVPRVIFALDEQPEYIVAAENSSMLVIDGKYVEKQQEIVSFQNNMAFVDVQIFTQELGGTGSFETNGFRCILKGHVLSGTAERISIDGTAVPAPAPSKMGGRWFVSASVFGKDGLYYPIIEVPEYKMVVFGLAPAEPEVLIRMFGIYLSPDGDDGAEGYPSAPVRTPDAAAALARSWKEAVNACGMDMTIFFQPGSYPAFSLHSEDSGTKQHAVRFRALKANTVSISSAVHLSSEAFTVSEDERIPEKARGKVYEANISGLLGTYVPYPTNLGYQSQVTTDYYQLYASGVQQQLARYPNEGWMRIGEVVPGIDPATGQTEEPEKSWGICANSNVFTCDDTRLQRWIQAQNLVFAGYWGYFWAYQAKAVSSISENTVILDGKTHFGIRPNNPVFAMNLLEELDIPGEWYIEPDNQKIYYYPKDGKLDSLELAVNADPVLQVSANTKFVFLEGLRFENNRHGVEMDGAEYITFQNCTFRNLGTHGLRVLDGRNVVVKDCIMNQLGGAGVQFDESGIRKNENVSLEMSENLVQGCRISSYNQTFRTVEGGIVIRGNGGIVENNCIFDAPHSGIYFAGNQIVIQNNEIYNVLQETADAGVIYTCARDYTKQGNQILRNYIHDISKESFDEKDSGRHAIYLDDMTSGAVVKNNVVDGCSSAALFGGGWNNLIEDNVFLNCDTGMQFDCRASITRKATHVASITPPNGETYVNTKASFERIAQSGAEERWREQYPVLMGKFKDMFQDFSVNPITADNDIGIPRENILRNNTFAAPNAEKYSYNKLYSKLFSYSFTGDGNIHEGTMGTTDTESVAYWDKIMPIQQQKLHQQQAVFIPQKMTLVTKAGTPASSLDGLQGTEVLLRAEYQNTLPQGINEVLFLAVFKENGVMTGGQQWRQTVSPGGVEIEKYLVVPEQAGKNTRIEFCAWSTEDMCPLHEKQLLPAGEWLDIETAEVKNGMLSLTGTILPKTQGKQVLMGVTQGEPLIDALLQPELLQKIDQTTTGEDGSFCFVSRMKQNKSTDFVVIYLWCGETETQICVPCRKDSV